MLAETQSTSHEAINVSHPGQVSALLRRATATTRSSSPEDSSEEDTSGIIQQLAYLQVFFFWLFSLPAPSEILLVLICCPCLLMRPAEYMVLHRIELKLISGGR